MIWNHQIGSRMGLRTRAHPRKMGMRQLIVHLFADGKVG